MTLFGVIFLTVCLIGLNKPVHFLFGILIFSCVCQGAAVFNIGGFGFPPYIIAEFFFIFRAMVQKQSVNMQRQRKGAQILQVFLVYCILITLFGPFIFAGIPVIVPGETSDYDLAEGTIVGHLSFSIKNMAQICFLALNSITVWCIIKVGSRISADYIITVFRKVIVFVLVIGFWEWSAKVLQLFDFFPDWFFYCNEGYEQLWLQGIRLNSVFLEPSYAGGFLSAALIYLLYRKEKNKILIFLTGLTLCLNLSGTGLMTVIIVMGINLLKNSKHRLKMILVVAILWGCLMIIGYAVLIEEMLTNKSTSISGLARMGAVIYSISLIQSTFFIGVGLGSHRCFSFVTNLLAAVGLFGFTMFFYFIKTQITGILRYGNKEYKAFVVFGLTLFIAQCLALPDLSFPVMWMWIFIVTAINCNKLRAPIRVITKGNGVYSHTGRY